MQLKPSALAGWTLFIVLLFLSIFYFLAGPTLATATGLATYIVLGTVELFIFGMPLLFLVKYRPLQGLCNLRVKKIGKYKLFVLYAALSVTFLSFVLNFLTTETGSGQGLSIYYPSSGNATFPEILTSIIALAVIPALIEELLIRGAIFSLYEKRGTLTAILVSSLSFAMLHTTPDALLSSFAAAVAYGFLVYITGSIWSGVFAHLVSNVYSILVTILAANYTFNLYWNYFFAVNIILFFVFAFLALRELEGHAKDGAMPFLEKGSNSFHLSLTGSVKNTGFLLFFILFLLRLALIFIIY